MVVPVDSCINWIVVPCLPIKCLPCALGTSNLAEQISGPETGNVKSGLIPSMSFTCLKILTAASIAGASSACVSSVADIKT